MAMADRAVAHCGGLTCVPVLCTCVGWQAFLEIDRLLQVPSLQATPIGATPLITFIHVKKTIRAQVSLKDVGNETSWHR